MEYIIDNTIQYDIKEPCPLADVCGGCSYQGVPYEDQLKNKAGEVKGYFKAQGLDPEMIKVIKGCPVQYGYRNKMEYSFGDAVKDGPMLLGLHKKKSFMSVIDTSQCQIVSDDYNSILKETLTFCLEKGYTHYHKKIHSGLMRNLVIRRGIRTKELLVNIVTTSEIPFDGEDYVNRLLALNTDDTIVGVLHTINDSNSDAVNVTELRTLYGRDYYMEEILGLKFKVGAFSFFQTNVQAAERLYSDALSLIPGIEGKTVFDLYCGTGTISQAMALKAKEVVGVEIVEEAVEAARINAKLNGLDNCRFIAEDVAKALSSIEEKPEVIVVDPPRSGMMPKALTQILAYKVPEILYISCNPKTMAENLRAAKLSGYETDSITLYDNFPFTKHTEAIALMKLCK